MGLCAAKRTEAFHTTPIRVIAPYSYTHARRLLFQISAIFADFGP
jgi:hypothetical protein